ncbi:T9SS type A sorting domain-containing protein [Bacteroides sp. OttesenSCG-928-J23]|nr:T9SS type A sorting domain-containing protein [Bacteroides sp. OttesenSCG-928-J23]
MKKGRLLAIACLLVSISSFAQTYSGGSGTESDPYLISSKEDMEELAEYDGSNTSGKYYLLTRNITEEITTSIDDFYGTFDGGGHNININVSDSWNAGAFGVFRYTSGATIKNLSVTGSIYSSFWFYYNYSYCGGICGKSSNTTITNCVASVSLSCNNHINYVGGICGYMTEHSRIKNCLALNPSIYSGNQGAKRIADIDNTSSIENCYALATMKLDGSTISSQDENWEDGKDIDKNTTITLSTCSHIETVILLCTYETIKWQRSSDNEQSWTDIDCTSPIYIESDPSPGQYIYRALNGDGTYSNYVKATYSDAIPPEVSTLPLASASKRVDESITFSLALTDSHYNYQWYKGDAPIEGATANTYTIPVLEIADAGIYTCRVWNGCNEVTSSNTMLIVDKALQVITLPDATLSKNYGDEDFTLPEVTDKNLPISYTSSNTQVATVTNNKVHITGLGITTITATQTGNSKYIAATPATLTLTVNKGQQVITFNALPEKTFGDPSFTLQASVNTGSAITFESSNTDVATISNNILIIQNAGTTYITASAASNDNYFAANPVQQRLTVNKATQYVTLDFISDKAYGDPSFTLNAWSSVELPITYVSSEPGKLIISNNQATIKSAGSFTITAQQAGNNNYLPASDSKTFTIQKTPLAIKPDDVIRKQGEPNPAFTLIYTGFKNGDTETVLDVLPSIDCLADENSPIGFYDIVLSGGSDNNYNYQLMNGRLEVVVATGISDASMLNLSFYPNPVESELFIQSESPIQKVEVYTQSGNCVLRDNNFNEKLNLSHLPDGFYFVRVYTDNAPKTGKIMIRK